jgi:hypothetical protein
MTYPAVQATVRTAVHIKRKYQFFPFHFRLSPQFIKITRDILSAVPVLYLLLYQIKAEK